VLYGIWQNILFIQGAAFHGEVMPGRPNATFTEPDWLGIYLVLLLAGVYALIYYFNNPPAGGPISLATPGLAKPEKFLGYAKSGKARKISKFLLYLFLILIYILLILTVSRSAWLGAGFITLVFLKAILTDFSIYWKNWRWKMFLQQAVLVICSGIASLLIIYSFNLTNFQLWNRAVSTGGLQKITIACESRSDLELPEEIGDVSELEKYDCRHINLEDIDQEKELGFEIKEIYRPDPNVNIRGQVFQKSWAEIKRHPVLGIGYGSIAAFLGQDERGVNLNASNIFLEVWLGSGLIGLLAFIFIWLNAMIVFVKRFYSSNNQEEKAFALFILLGIFAFLIPNLFNAGIFLMILWFFWGIVPIKYSHNI
jgi:O-antigen ligase